MIDEKNYHYYDVVDSTNQKAKELAKSGCPNYTIVSAGTQTHGRGRSGRQWDSEENATVLTSIVLYPTVAIEHVSRLTLVAAVAVYRAVTETISQAFFDGQDSQKVSGILKEYLPTIKWPNDVLLKKKKICGILTEMSVTDNQIDYVVVGIGVNVHNRAFPKELQEKATSIDLMMEELGQSFHVSRKELTIKIWESFQQCYEAFCIHEDLSFCLEEYNEHLENTNQLVRVLDPLGEYTGTALGINEIGELLVETDEGVQRVSSGEVSVRGLYGYM